MPIGPASEAETRDCLTLANPGQPGQREENVKIRSVRKKSEEKGEREREEKEKTLCVCL